MSISYFTESEAPRDFRVSSTESDGHYTKCLLCYTVKRNFYCVDCIRAGNFVNSSMPYSDNFAEKHGKLLRLRANRKHVLDRCEKLLSNKIKKDKLQTESKQSKDKIELLKLAIEQRKNAIEEKKKQLADLVHNNSELKLKLPRYQKRVASLGKHAQVQRIELQQKINTYNDQALSLAALRRSRIRQLTNYIFPVYMSFDTSDSIEDMEFLGDIPEPEPPRKTQLHIVAPWINVDGDFSEFDAWNASRKESIPPSSPREQGTLRAAAALGLAAQLIALIAWSLDARLPHAISLSEYWSTGSWSGARARRLCRCAAALCARAAVPPPPQPLAALHALCMAASAEHAPLGRVEGWMSSSVVEASEAWESARGWGALDEVARDDAEPEHLEWPDAAELEEVSSTPPAPAPSLVTSAAASLASILRGWTKS